MFVCLTLTKKNPLSHNEELKSAEATPTIARKERGKKAD